MILGLTIFLWIALFISLLGAEVTDRDRWITAAIVVFVLALIITIFGCFNGFINYPQTEGTHQGVITAVDLEGVHFRRYEVYLKSSGYTNQSDETVYRIYDYETELAEQLKNAIGKTVKIHYGHDGGYINWKSCGTYHIKSIEILEEENVK